ncbi:MAG: AAA family ATPase [Candidatus Lokiarchaeota archaeon]|nr:AAA family ATPase [Candidatus Lokiarchaeota archaeon]MBD3341457.1 AAA family ATPase [Candidatus Lokiarchaeota archaeon]
MVKPIYLCSLRGRVGKTFLSIGIIRKLQNEGKNVAYFKPIGIPKGAFTNKADVDVGFIQNTVISSDIPYDLHSPVSIPDCYYVDLIDSAQKETNLQKIRDAYDKIVKDMDYVVIEGNPTIKKYIRVGLDDISIAEALDINELVFIETESSDKCIDNLFFTLKYFKFRKINIKGVIFNKIDYDYQARIEELQENHIKRYGIPILGVIGKSIELLAPRVSEMMYAIGGELLNEAASAGLDNIVETYVIGAMNAQAALKYLRQVKRAAVITGGDRTDLALAALNQDVSALILTGFIQPDIKVISAANSIGIPIILSPSDTYTTIRNMERLHPGIQEAEIDLVLETIKSGVKWDLLLQ